MLLAIWVLEHVQFTVSFPCLPKRALVPLGSLHQSVFDISSALGYGEVRTQYSCWMFLICLVRVTEVSPDELAIQGKSKCILFLYSIFLVPICVLLPVNLCAERFFWSGERSQSYSGPAYSCCHSERTLIERLSFHLKGLLYLERLGSLALDPNSARHICVVWTQQLLSSSVAPVTLLRFFEQLV